MWNLLRRYWRRLWGGDPYKDFTRLDCYRALLRYPNNEEKA